MIRIFSQYVSVKSLLLMLLESLVIALSLVCGVKLRFWNEPGEFEFYTMLPDFGAQALIVIVIFQVCFYYNDLYDLSAVRRRSEQLIRLCQSLGAACLLLGFLYLWAPALLIVRGVFFITMVVSITSIMVTRAALEGAWQVTASPDNVLILGTGELAITLARELSKRDDLNLRLAGFVASKDADFPPGGQLFGHPVVGSAKDLERLTIEHRVSRIVVAMEDSRGSLPVRDLVKLRVEGIEVEDVHSAIAALTGRVWLGTVRPSWFVFSQGFRRSGLIIVLKRTVDLCFGLVGLVLSAPVMLLVAIAIRLDSRGPILYRQERVGLRGRRFWVLKFRSMRVDAEEGEKAQWAQQDDPRATPLGKFIRKVRLDELPQFLNVLRGEMSFVGPRPERPVFVDMLREKIPYYDERHSVRPGVTGWAQVQYPYGASVEDAYRKLEYDLFYLQNMSALFDCAIVFQTVRIVLFGRGGR